MNTSEIETILKHAPLPKAPAGLRERLCGQAGRSGIRTSHSLSSGAHTRTGWIRRWWPNLAPAAVSLACATVFTFQQRQIRELKTPLANPPEAPHQTASVATSNVARGSFGSGGSTTETDELARLQAVAAQLRSDIAQLEQVRSQNDAMRKELAARAANRLSPEETRSLEEASRN